MIPGHVVIEGHALAAGGVGSGVIDGWVGCRGGGDGGDVDNAGCSALGHPDIDLDWGAGSLGQGGHRGADHGGPAQARCAIELEAIGATAILETRISNCRL